MREDIYKKKAGEEDTIKEITQQIQQEVEDKGKKDREEKDR